MSIKTLRKRIALVAVSALGVGLLSVAPASATTGVFVTAGITGTGVIVAPAGSTTGQTMTISSTGSVTITTVAGTDLEAKLTVSGGRITTALDASYAPTAPDAGLATDTSFTYGNEVNYITFVPNAGVSSMTITSYVSSSAATAGTKAAELIVLIKSAASVGVVDASNSFANVVAAGTTDDPTNDVDVSTAISVANPTNGRINFDLYDGNNVAMSSSTVLGATATGGCLVGWTNSATAFLGASSSTTYNASSQDEVFIARSVANSPFACTITLTANGIEFAKKSIKLEGKVVKVEATDLVLAKKNATTSSAFYFAAYDSAGNEVNGVTVSTVDTSTDAFASSTAGTTDEVNGATGSIVCNDVEGSGSFKLRVTNATNDLVDSPVYTVQCRGSAANYTAALDKAVYAPGDIATLTITAKTSKGNAVHDLVYLGGATADGTGAANPPAIAGSNLTAISAPTSVDKFTNGVKTYKFVVGSTEGNYQLSVDLPKFNTTLYNQAAVTVAYSIKSPTGTVSNAEVLAAIVKLIASINKQIRALQKSLKR